MEYLHKALVNSTLKAIKNGIYWNQCGKCIQWDVHKICEYKKEAKCEPFNKITYTSIVSIRNISEINESVYSLAEESVQSKYDNIEVSVRLRTLKSRNNKIKCAKNTH